MISIKLSASVCKNRRNKKNKKEREPFIMELRNCKLSKYKRSRQVAPGDVYGKVWGILYVDVAFASFAFIEISRTLGLPQL